MATIRVRKGFSTFRIKPYGYDVHSQYWQAVECVDYGMLFSNDNILIIQNPRHYGIPTTWVTHSLGLCGASSHTECVALELRHHAGVTD